MQGTQVQSLIWEDSTRKQGSFLGCSVVKILPVMQDTHLETGLILGLGRSHGGRHGNLLQYSCLEKLMDRGARRATVQGVTKSQTWLKQLSTHGPHFPGSYAILFFTASDFTFTTSHIHNWTFFPLWLRLFFLSGAISLLFSVRILGTYQCGEFIFQCPFFFAFSYCSWDSQGKNTEMVCHSLLQWTTFCQNSPPWPVHLGWSYTAWLIVSVS